MVHIYYTKGRDHQLHKVYTHTPPVLLPTVKVSHPYLAVTDGILSIGQGYTWDGASGPTWDTPNLKRGSLVHDAGYQLIREGYYKGIEDEAKKFYDSEFRRILLEDGTWKVRAWYYYRGVVRFGKRSTTKEAIRPVLVAP